MVIPVDGGRMQRLGPPMLRGREPHWSPDGRSIAFLEYSEEGPHRFRILNLTTDRVKTVFKSEGVVRFSPGRLMAAGSPSLATRRVECEEFVLDDYCDSVDLWIVNALNARRTLIHSFGQDGRNVTSIDWRRSR